MKKARLVSAGVVAIPLLLFGATAGPAGADPVPGCAIVGGPVDPALCLILPPPGPYVGPPPEPGKISLDPEVDDYLEGAAEDARQDLPLPPWVYLDPEQIPLVLMPPEVEHDPEICDPNYGCGNQQPH